MKWLTHCWKLNALFLTIFQYLTKSKIICHTASISLHKWFSSSSCTFYFCVFCELVFFRTLEVEIPFLKSNILIWLVNWKINQGTNNLVNSANWSLMLKLHQKTGHSCDSCRHYDNLIAAYMPPYFSNYFVLIPSLNFLVGCFSFFPSNLDYCAFLFIVYFAS